MNSPKRRESDGPWVITSKDGIHSGVPLGGLGAGKLELTPDGLLNNFTFQNNWSNPLSGSTDYPGVLGFHFGVRSGKKAALLQTAPIVGLPHVRHIRYEGIFPRAKLKFEEPALGLQVVLEAFSPWLPGDVKNSSLPACIFKITLTNRKKIPVDAGFIFMGRNVSGDWCVGRQNRIHLQKNAVHLEFKNVYPPKQDARSGSLCFSFMTRGWDFSFMESWNAATRNFSFDPGSIALAAWDYFARGEALPDTRPRFTAAGENQELCGSLAASTELLPGESKQIDFSAAWHFPGHPLGHRYQKWFKSSVETSSYVLKNKELFRKKGSAIEKAVFSLPFPRWFNTALLTNLVPFFASSWYVRDGRFAFYEAPQSCPLMGTIDVGFYGSIPLSYFFPELEISLLTQFAKAQRPDGYIPHDLGRNRLDLPSNGTTFYFWKDLNPKFILMAYRDFLWSGDSKFLKKIYPHVKKALAWSLAADRDGNGLPDHEGADQTFDLWNFYGTHAYTAGLFLAALLASQKMAGTLGDRRFSRECRLAFAKGRKSFDSELWNGKYFGSVSSCALSQLSGQWYADLLGLGSIADPAKIRKALTFILGHNSRPSAYGMVNSVLPSGQADVSNDHSKNIWSGMNYAFVSLCLMRGFGLSPLLKEVHKIWDNVTRVQKSPWNQPDTIDFKTGGYVFGDSYYRNMAIWSIPIAFSMRDSRTAGILRRIRETSVLKKRINS